MGGDRPDFLMSHEPSSIRDQQDIDAVLSHVFEIGASDVYLTGGRRAFVLLHEEVHDVTRRVLTNEEVETAMKLISNDGALVALRAGEDLDGRYGVPVYEQVAGTKIEVDRKRFRWNAIAVTSSVREDGLIITMRTIRATPPKLSELKVEPEISAAFNQKDGLILVCGGTGQGKTTLLAAHIRAMLEDVSRSLNIATYESPVEISYDGIDSLRSRIHQSEVPTNICSFERAARNAMRRHAHVLLIGETRDLATLEATLALADSGHLALTTLHANDVPQVISRVASWFTPAERMSRVASLCDAMRLVVVQRLIKSETTGGMVAVREYLQFDAEVRDQIRVAESMRELSIVIRTAVERKGQSFYAAALRFFNEGAISREQLQTFERRPSEDESFNMTL